MNSIEIRNFDLQKATIYAVRDEDQEKLLGLVFQDPESPFSQIICVSHVVEAATIDLFDCAAMVQAHHTPKDHRTGGQNAQMDAK